MRLGRRVRAVFIRLLLCAQFLCIPALTAATTLVAVRTSTDIYLGADSSCDQKTLAPFPRLSVRYAMVKQCSSGFGVAVQNCQLLSIL